MIPVYSYPQFPPQGSAHVFNGKLANPVYYTLQAIFKRTGGNSGIPTTVGTNLAATGLVQNTALALTNDYNEVLSQSVAGAGTQLAPLQQGQSQTVFNGSGSALNVYPASGGTIAGNTMNGAYSVPSGASVTFTAYQNQNNGQTLLRPTSPLSAPIASPPSPATGVEFLRDDLTWAIPPVFLPSGPTHAVGYVPDPGAVAGVTRFLREDATWAAPSGGGYGINVTNNGLVGDGVTDNSAAWATLVASLATPGALLYFPKGKYVFASSVSFSYPASNVLFNLSLVGDGQDATVIKFSSGNGMTITLNDNSTATNNQSFHARELAFTTSGTVAGTALTVTQAGSNNGDFAALSELTRVIFRGDDGYCATNGWNQAVLLNGISNVNIVGCGFYGPGAIGGSGVKFQGLNGSNVATVINFTSNTFALLAVGAVYGDFVQGITFAATNFSGCTSGIFVPGGLTAIGAQLSISDCQFGQYASSTNAIVVSTALNDLSIVNSLFLLNNTSQGGVVMAASSNTTINGNEFQALNTGTSIIGISMTSAVASTGVVIVNNIFTSFNGSSSAAWTASASMLSVETAHNQYINCHSPPFSDLSVGASVAYDWWTHNAQGDFGFVIRNGHGAVGDHGLAIWCGASGATVDAGTVIMSFATGNGSATVGSITRDGAVGISLNQVSNISDAGANMTIGAVSTITGPGANILTFTNTVTPVGNFAFIFKSPNGLAGNDGAVIQCGRAGVSSPGVPLTDSTTAILNFANGDGTATAGSITRNGTGVSFNVSSDERLKTDITDSDDGLSIIRRLRVREFVFRGDPERRRVQGFIAQELFEPYPIAVHAGGDDVVRDPWGVDHGRLTPALTRSVQQLDEIIAAQQKTIDGLVAEVKRLEPAVLRLEPD